MPTAIVNCSRTNTRLFRRLTLAILVSLPLCSVNAEELEPEWNCTADDSGNWQCDQEIGSTAQNRTARPARSNNPSRNPDEPRVAKVRNLDWVQEENMSEDQKAALDQYCCGAYTEPPRDYPDADIPPEEASLRLNANSTEAIDENIALLEGDVQISQGYRQISSNKATVDQAARQVTLEGDVRFR